MKKASMTRSLEDYLECIYRLILEKKPARVCDIAEELGVTRPSVVNGIRQLTAQGYVTHPRYRSAELTEKGRETAVEILARHQLLLSFLKALGVPAAVAEADACRMEHILSPETYRAVKLFLEREICP